jgi:hypothetical protein
MCVCTTLVPSKPPTDRPGVLQAPAPLPPEMVS